MIEEEIKELDTHIAEHPEDAEALYRRGALKWKLGRKGEALSDFAASAKIAPDGPGATAAEAARSIFDFYNTDLYNP